MKYLVSILVALLTICCNASADTTGVLKDTAAITVVSDTLADDTSNFVITTTIPKGIQHSIQNIFSEKETITDTFFNLLNLGGLGVILFILAGILLFLLVIALSLLPFALLFLLIWLLVRNSKRAKKADMEIDDMKTDNPIRSESYINRRDNAIKNTAIGLGIFILFAFLDIKFGMGIGLLIVFWGIGGIVVAQNHRNNK